MARVYYIAKTRLKKGLVFVIKELLSVSDNTIIVNFQKGKKTFIKDVTLLFLKAV